MTTYQIAALAATETPETLSDRVERIMEQPKILRCWRCGAKLEVEFDTPLTEQDEIVCGRCE